MCAPPLTRLPLPQGLLQPVRPHVLGLLLLLLLGLVVLLLHRAHGVAARTCHAEPSAPLALPSDGAPGARPPRHPITTKPSPQTHTRIADERTRRFLVLLGAEGHFPNGRSRTSTAAAARGWPEINISSGEHCGRESPQEGGKGF